MTDTEKQPGKPINMEDNVNAPRETVFHYSRERRLNRASPQVQALNEGQFIKPNFFKTLLTTRSHRLLLFAIVFVFASSGLAVRFTGRQGQGQQEQGMRLGGNSLALTIVSVEGMLLLGIVKNAPRSGELYIGPVDIAVSPVISGSETGEASQIFTHRVFFNPVETETFRISLPFEETDFFVILKTHDEQRSLRLRVREN
jgi:hypothetical protein